VFAMVECRRFTVGNLMIYVVVSEILLLPVTWLPSWISSTHQRPTKSESTTTRKLDPENISVAVRNLSLCALELEICLGPFHPPVGGKRQTSQKNRCREKD